MRLVLVRLAHPGGQDLPSTSRLGVLLAPSANKSAGLGGGVCILEPLAAVAAAAAAAAAATAAAAAGPAVAVAAATAVDVEEDDDEDEEDLRPEMGAEIEGRRLTRLSGRPSSASRSI